MPFVSTRAKEMREHLADLCNLFKPTRRQHMWACSRLDNAETSDKHIETNLCTTIQLVCGTKQYWLIR